MAGGSIESRMRTSNDSGLTAPNVSGLNRGQRERQMSASTRTAQPTLGTRQFGIALVATVGLATVLALTLVIGQPVAPKAQTAPAAGAPPSFIDHGSRDEIGPWAPVDGAPPSFIDHGSRGEIGPWVSVPPTFIAPGASSLVDKEARDAAAAANAANAANAAKASVGRDHMRHLRRTRSTDGASSNGPRRLPQ
jgi:hypothetical protein